MQPGGIALEEARLGGALLWALLLWWPPLPSAEEGHSLRLPKICPQDGL